MSWLGRFIAAALGGLAALLICLSYVPEADSSEYRRRANQANTTTAPIYAGEAFFGADYTWDWIVLGSEIDAQQDGGVISAWPVRSDAGTLLAGHTDGGMVLGYQSSTGLAAAGIGTAEANHGQSFQGGWWQRNSGVTFPGYSGPGFKALTRIVFAHESGASGTAGMLVSGARSGVGAFSILAHSLTQFRVTLQTIEGVYSAVVTAPQGITTGPHILDVFTSDSEDSGPLARLNSMLWLDGVYMGAAEHTADQSAWTSNQMNQVAVGAGIAGAAPLLGRTVYGVAMATNANQSWWAGYDSTYAACVAIGLCPSMGSGSSRGTGRGLIQGDGGILNIVQPASFIADGRTRTGLGVVTPSTYDPSAPADLYLHLCGCTWTGATCRGSYLGGSAATANPNLEAGDPQAIHAYLDAQYVDPTDCAGGVGWVKGDTARSDLQLRYVDAVAAYMRQNYAVRATWIVGRSNGSGFAHWYAAMRPHLVSGVADTIGYWPGAANGGGGQMTSTAAVGRNPVYAMHNADDPTVRADFARELVPQYLARNLGIDAGRSDGSIGTCVGMDAGGPDGGQILTGCGCGGVQSTYDGGSNGTCCTWTVGGGGLDGGLALPFRYCESRVGGHVPPGGEGERIRAFFLQYGEDAGG